MDFNFRPVFYMQVGATSPRTMKILPSSRSTTQKIAVGDHNGAVTCFGMKKGDANVVFKTLPGAKISKLQLGGSSDGGRDKVYVASEGEVRGYSKKGKQFLTFDTNLTEPIQTLWVEGSSLFVSGAYTYNHYVDGSDANYYLCSDRINDILCLPPSHTHQASADHTHHQLSPVLACQDNTLRVLKDSDLLYEVEVAGPPLCIALNGQDGGEDGEEVLYGTQNGKLGLVKLEAHEPSYRWDMLNERKHGGISSITTRDLSRDGIHDVIVGRDDGVVEVYAFDDHDQPRLKFTHVFNESVTSVDGGVVSSSNYEEVAVVTYSGRVLGLTSEPRPLQPVSKETKAKIQALKEEVEGLEARVTQAKERYQQTVVSAKDSHDTVSALLPFPINDRLVLNQDEAWYTLSIEIEAPIDTVVLQSNVPLDLQEVDKSTAVVSYTPPDTENNNYLLATFRCHDTSRLEVKVRSIEGQFGVLQAYISPRLEPKSCRVRQYHIKPLSLHRRAHNFEESRPCNVLKVTGPFSLGEVHSWIQYLLPDISDQPSAEDLCTLHFKSTFIHSQLECSYRKGEAVFRSDNPSTISVVREVLSKEATRKKIAVKITHDLADASVLHMLQLVFPRLEEQLMLAKNAQLIEALREIKIHEEDSFQFVPQCQEVIDHAEAIQDRLKQQSCLIERLYALITDLFMDVATFKSLSVKSKVPDLLALLDQCELDSLADFFQTNLALSWEGATPPPAGEGAGLPEAEEEEGERAYS